MMKKFTDLMSYKIVYFHHPYTMGNGNKGRRGSNGNDIKEIKSNKDNGNTLTSAKGEDEVIKLFHLELLLCFSICFI